MSELQKRVLSAAVLAPIALAALVAGGTPFMLLVILVGAIGLYEWFMITGRRFLWALGGFAYIAAPSAALVIFREAPAPTGWAAILLLLAVVWATDIAAFFAGRALGGPKLWPRVSPKKTWSGALGGLAAAIVCGGLVTAFSGIGGFLAGATLAIPLSIAAQAGDLLESAVKRRFGVKDSGKIIPGHGGVLDRVDGVLGAGLAALLIAGLGLGQGVFVLFGDGAAP